VRSTLIPSAAKTASNAPVNCPARSRMRYRTCPSRPVSVQVNCRAACAVHSAVGCAVIPGRWTNRVRTSMTKNYVHPREVNQLHMEKVAGHEDFGVGAQERAPRVHGGALRGRRDPVRAQDLADRGGGHAMTKAAQLALDPRVAPGGVLAREPDDQGHEFGRDRQPPGPGRWLPPLPPHQPPVPA
jgi:hypothetical protein